MAPLPVNSTARLWVKKSGISGEHETMFRFIAGTTQSEAVTGVHIICEEMASFLWEDDAFISARWAADGSNLSFPVAWDVIPGENPGTPDEAQYPGFVSWVGRGADGREVRWTLNGVPFTADDNYRIFASESITVEAVRFALETELTIANIGSFHPVVYNYVNLGYNAYFQRKARRS
jgi:predicted amino acid dehydrogenase